MSCLSEFGEPARGERFTAEREVSRACRVRLWPDPGRFLPSERRRSSTPHWLDSNRSAAVVGRRQDPPAAIRTQFAALWPPPHDRSSRGCAPKGGRAPHVPARQDGPWLLPSREDSPPRPYLPRGAEIACRPAAAIQLRLAGPAVAGLLLFYRQNWRKACDRKPAVSDRDNVNRRAGIQTVANSKSGHSLQGRDPRALWWARNSERST